jgi:hypothetical protein
LELAFDIPQNGGLGVPIRESVAQVGEITREKPSDALIRDQITQGPGDLPKTENSQ